MKKLKMHILVFILLIFTLFLLPVLTYSDDFLVSTEDTQYIDALKAWNSELKISEYDFPFTIRIFENGSNTTLFDTQADILSDIQKNYTFIPQIKQTVIIAIDRNQTSENIRSFRQLIDSSLEINFDFPLETDDNTWEYPRTHQIILSMSHALYGEYDMGKIAKDLGKIHSKNRFFTNDMSKPILVTYDSIAVDLIKNGRNLDIIIPQDGTFSFDFGAFIADNTLVFDDEFDEILLEQGFRLSDGRADIKFYPLNYTNATSVPDIEAFNEASINVSRTLLRDVCDTDYYGFANTKETVIFYLVFLFLLIIYLFSIIYRVTDKKTRNVLVFVCSLLILFITLGFFKALITHTEELETAIWYSYYIPIIMIPTSFIFIATNTGSFVKKEWATMLPKPFFIISTIMLIFVLTNNFHSLVFIVHDHLKTHYSYNIGYIFVMIWIYIVVLISLTMLIYDSFRSPKKSAFLLPLLATVIALCYTLSFAMRVPFISDFSTSFGLSVILLIYCEACMQSRLIPINKGYKKLFSNSNLSMEIRDSKQNTIIKTNNIKEHDENFILRKSRITGGEFLYYEDNSSLNKALEKLAKINHELCKNNEFLRQKGKINAELSALTAEKIAYKNVDKIILRGTRKIEKVLEDIKTQDNVQKSIAKINIISSSIKRECMLIVSVLYKNSQPVSDLVSVISELDEFCAPIGLKITVSSRLEGDISIIDSLGAYRLFCMLAENATENDCKNLLVQIYKKDEQIVFTVSADKSLMCESTLKEIKLKIETDNRKITIKEWDESEVYMLTFNEF